MGFRTLLLAFWLGLCNVVADARRSRGILQGKPRGWLLCCLNPKKPLAIYDIWFLRDLHPMAFLLGVISTTWCTSLCLHVASKPQIPSRWNFYEFVPFVFVFCQRETSLPSHSSRSQLKSLKRKSLLIFYQPIFQDDFDEAVSLEPAPQPPTVPSHPQRARRAEGAQRAQSLAPQPPHEADLIGTLEQRALERRRKSGNLMSQFMRESLGIVFAG